MGKERLSCELLRLLTRLMLLTFHDNLRDLSVITSGEHMYLKSQRRQNRDNPRWTLPVYTTNVDDIETHDLSFNESELDEA